MSQDFDFFVPEEKNFGKHVQPFDQDQIPKEPFIVISGFPYDEGTKRNGGRIGGSVASLMFRKTLLSHQIYPKSQKVNLFDAGDIEKEMDLEKAHQQLFEKHFQLLKLCGQQQNKGLLFSIGGSNDQSYPNVKALMDNFPNSKIGVINIDQHFDVRPLVEGKAHSGSPFRLMLENETFSKNGSKFIEFAAKGATNSKSHAEYLESKKVEVYWLEKHIRKHAVAQTSESENRYSTQAGQVFEKIVQKLSAQCEHIFVSFDLDSINCKWMPGVSAPSVIGGLTNEEAFEIMQITGRSTKVRLVDFSQMNPAVESLVSCRLAVEMLYTLSESFSERPSQS